MVNTENSNQLLHGLLRIEDLLTAIARKILKEDLESALKENGRRFLYEHTGKLPVKQLAKKNGALDRNDFENLAGIGAVGLLIKDGKQYRQVLANE